MHTFSNEYLASLRLVTLRAMSPILHQSDTSDSSIKAAYWKYRKQKQSFRVIQINSLNSLLDKNNFKYLSNERITPIRVQYRTCISFYLYLAKISK